MGAEYCDYLGRTQGSPARAMLVIALNCIFKTTLFRRLYNTNAK